MITFVVIYYTKRRANLDQMLRFLQAREPYCLGGELITVCQDGDEKPPTSFTRHEHYNLGIDTYRKTVLCNFGVERASNPVVALLDGDRVLPAGFFKKAAGLAGGGVFVTATFLYQLSRAHTDEEVERGEVECWEDFRCRENSMFRKNLFAGNTVFRRQDYLDLGGMSDEFVGYGFSDTDMTMKCLRAGKRVAYLGDKEYHLWHERNIDWSGSNVGSNLFRITTAINALRYCNKWRVFGNLEMYNHAQKIEADLGSFPPEAVTEYLRMKAEYLGWSASRKTQLL